MGLAPRELKTIILWNIRNLNSANLGKLTGVEIEIERKISKSELKLPAEYLTTNLFHTAKKIYMFYYLKDNPNRDFARGTTNFDNDKIEITINDS